MIVSHHLAFFGSYCIPRLISKGYDKYAPSNVKKKINALIHLSPTFSRFLLITLPDNGPTAAVILLGRVKKLTDIHDWKTVCVIVTFTLITAKVLEIFRFSTASAMEFLFDDKLSLISEIVGPRDFYHSNQE